MKKLLTFFSLLFLLVLCGSISAQSTTDTVYIPGSQSLEISNIINADTSVTDYRVYVLDRGAIYYIETAFELTSSCKFMATGSADRPPVLAPAIRADNSSEEWFFKLVRVGIDVEINDLYLLSMRSDGQTLGWSRAISVQSSDCSLKMRNVVLDGWTEAGIRVQADKYKLDVQDCHFRNFIHSSSYFGGQPFMTDYNYPDSVSFINNTFFAVNAYLFSIRALGPYANFEHNTIAYTAVNPLITRFADNLYLNNNLFYAAHAWGGDPDQTINGWFLNWPDTVSSSIYQVRASFDYDGYTGITPPSYFNNEDYGVFYDSTTFTRVAKNNVFYQPQALLDYYTQWNDTVTTYDSVDVDGVKQYLRRVINPAKFISGYVQAVIDSSTDPNSAWYSPNFDVEDAINEDPQFTDAGTVGHVDELIGYVNRIISRTLDEGWQYEMNFPPTWPLPEDLSYSNTALQSGGTDGFAIGDLNWFPEQKAQWLITDVKEVNGNTIPDEFELSDAYPNPFNPSTNINFKIASVTNVKLSVYNLLGEKIKTIVDSEMKAGNYEAVWNGVDDFGHQVASGTYFITLESSSFRATKKIMLLK